MLVEDFLQESARRSPGRAALVCGGRRFTYGELDAEAGRVAAGLRERGLTRGGRVVIHLDNSLEAVLSVFGTLKAGGVFVVVNPTVKADKLAHILTDCGATVLVSDQRTGPIAAEAAGQAPLVRELVLCGDRDIQPMPGLAVPVSAFSSLLAAEAGGVAAGTIDLDLAALIYTSGSTGRPKGVMLSHLNMVAAATSINGYLGNSEDDVILDMLPLSFDYGLYQVLLAFQAGACVVLERSMTYPAVMLDLLVRERVTGLPIVPMVAALLLKHDLSGYDLSALRYITNTGAALPVAHIEALRTRLPGVRIFSMYGLTECKRVSYLDPDEIERRPTSVGKPMDNVDVYVVDADGRRVDTGVGELVIRGSNVMQGYWGAPEDTDRVLKTDPQTGDRLLFTGDIFRIDDEGYLHFVSRTDDVIKCRGQKVSPREVEDVLHTAAGVLEAAVVGVPDPVMGEAVKAFVTLAPGAAASEQELLRHCARHLEDIMIPRAIEIVESLPRTDSGKTARRALQAVQP